jgi:hypothetical protein
MTNSFKIQRYHFNRKRLSIKNVAFHCHLTLDRDNVALRTGPIQHDFNTLICSKELMTEKNPMKIQRFTTVQK